MSRQRVGIIIGDLSGGDAIFQVVSEEDYKTVCAFNPTREYDDIQHGKKQILDVDKYQEMVGAYFYDAEKDGSNEKVLKEFFTQIFAPKKIDLSEYDIVGILTLPD